MARIRRIPNQTNLTMTTITVLSHLSLLLALLSWVDNKSTPLGCNAFSTRFSRRRPFGSSSSSKNSATCLTATQYDRCDVAVFGGGFGGLYTALALDREANKNAKTNATNNNNNNKKPLDIVLVDPGDRFVFLPLLYDLTMGTATENEVCPTFTELLEGTRIRHVKASFDGFDGGDSELISAARLTQPSFSQDSNSDFTVTMSEDVAEIKLSFDAAVVSTGATPQKILSAVPGAAEYVQPFYTREDAWSTRDVLFRLEQKVRRGERPRVAVVGGGYGGVELAACLARKLPEAETVTLMTRGPPMKGTKAEDLVDMALQRLGVSVQVCSVDRIEPVVDNDEEDDTSQASSRNQKVCVYTSGLDDSTPSDDSTVGEEVWDVVFWTAGSAPSYPVPDSLDILDATWSGRLCIDDTLRCTNVIAGNPPPVWALGDCAEINPNKSDGPAVPRTAQAAIQQADVVAHNILCTLERRNEDVKSFQFQDLGTVLSLGGPLAAIVGPRDDSLFGPAFGTLLDTARVGLNVADELVSQALKSSPQAEKLGITPLVDNLSLSLGGYGLGVDPETAPGTLAGTISGAARRAIYAVRMPTNKQRAYAAASAAISSASSLAKEAADQLSKSAEADKR
mmetsp:Transcript_41678/g.99964  ORF Transcript_41678/g.99964 Transcript_41678/m.99964 type:complete len:623 (-) Transcript_41678:1675-3543(-)